MANTATVVQLPGLTPLGPAGQYVWGPGDAQEPAIVLKVTITGDGAATTVTVNWIDGTQTIPFTPTMVRAHLTGAGTTAAGALVADNGGVLPTGATARVQTITNTGCILNLATAITNAATAVVYMELFK